MIAVKILNMQKKNPILNFRIESKVELLKLHSEKYCLKKGVHKSSLLALMENSQFSATLITKSRESVDMSETSYL